MKKKDEEQSMIQQSRFILMGEMMANISHQWKQPLNTMGLALINARFASKEEQDKYFEIIEDNIAYLASTIDDFLSFFNKKTNAKPRSLDDLLHEAESIIYTNISNKSIKLNISYPKKAKELFLNSSISQVILNLVNNSNDAFDNEKKDSFINLDFDIGEDIFTINCCDNANGIKEDILEKIFDSYFTTKAQSKGTGIGLYMSKQIITEVFHGEISVSSITKEKSPKECGTCFEIKIPYSKECIKGYK